MTLAAIDIGGTGSRYALFEHGVRPVPEIGPAIRVGRSGIDAEKMLREILEGAESRRISTGVVRPSAVVVGMSGLLALVDTVGDITAAIQEVWPGAKTALTSDSVTAMVGALGFTGGGVVAAGTGVVGLGSDFENIWHRVDGWGHVLGDDGGGAWLGAAGLKAGLRAHDGRGGSVLLLKALIDRFGAPEKLPRQIYTREDRAGVLASFAPEVVRAAEAGDVIAEQIVSRAAELLAETAIACLLDGVPKRVSLVGGLRQIGAPILEGFARAVHARGDFEIVEPAGDPMSGAFALAELLSTDPDRVPHRPPYITTEVP